VEDTELEEEDEEDEEDEEEEEGLSLRRRRNGSLQLEHGRMTSRASEGAWGLRRRRLITGSAHPSK